jgi:uncharacterized protein (AIM24 family)
MRSWVNGGESQVVEVELKEGQKLRAETGCLLYMTNGVEMDTGTGGGMMKGLTRMVCLTGYLVYGIGWGGIGGGGGIPM